MKEVSAPREIGHTRILSIPSFLFARQHYSHQHQMGSIVLGCIIDVVVVGVLVAIDLLRASIAASKLI